MTARSPLLALTQGDPSGIGPEVVAKALSKPEVRSLADLSVVGSAQVLFDAWRRLSLPGAPPPVTEIQGVPEGPFPIGQLSLDSARAAHAWIEFAAKLCLAGEAAAMVTAPVNKDAFQRAGIADTGHQEVLSRLSGATNVKTMLISGRLRCMHLSTHKSLAEACRYVTRENVLAAVQLTHAHFAGWGVPSPRIAVAALNPHASDNGLIGREELDEIAPAVTEACALGIDASGPHPADSVFNAAIVLLAFVQFGLWLFGDGLIPLALLLTLFFVAWTILMIFIYSIGYHNYGQPAGEHDRPGFPPEGATIKDEKGGIVSVLADDSLDMRTLEVAPPGKAPVKSHESEFRVGLIAPTTRPGTYDVFVSVGKRDGTPVIALPLADEDGQRRYRLGRIEIVEKGK